MKKTIVIVLLLSAGIAAKVSKADFVFGEPTNLGPELNSSARDEEPGISADGLELYYCSQRSGGHGGYDMWVSTRPTTEDDWGPPVNLGLPVNSSSDDFSEDISADGLELYFGSNRPGGSGYDIWVAKRATTEDAWTTPVNLGPQVNSSAAEGCPAISDDGLELYFWSTRSGGYGSYEIWVSKRETKEDAWSTAVHLGAEINCSAADLCTDVSPDGLSLIFVSARPGGYGGNIGDLWLTRRLTISDPWGPSVNLGPIVNSSGNENGPCLSADGSMLYYSCDWPGGSGSQDMWQVSISPVVDLNDDGIVDAADMCIIVDNWGTDEPLCDIGPMPWGDGIVDVQDLIVLAEHLFEEIYPPELIAYWKLDEAEGDITFNSTSDNHGILSGSPTWQPETGKVDGALELDGINDYVETGFVLDPAEGAFSVFAWIKGGAPGQVIISQTDGTGASETWFGTDASTGNLMTELVPPPMGRFVPQPLESQSVVTDGLWHHVGFVWDGRYRILYVDGTEVAKDTSILSQPLVSSTGGLHIGAGKNPDAGTFFSGLIDDVRIYDKALTAEEIVVSAQ
jgi:hypothetical protein